MASHMSLRIKAAAVCVLVFSMGFGASQDSTPQGPTNPGIAPNCNKFHTVVSGDTCSTLETRFGITAAQFLAWNPAVSSDCLTNFWLGNAYCVGIGSATTSKSTTSSTTSKTTSSSTTSKTTSSGTTSKTTSSGTTSKTTSSTSSTKPSTTNTTPYSIRRPVTSYNLTAPYKATAYPPAHTLAGQPSYCNQWHWVAGGETCQTIVNIYSNKLTLAQLIEYNPTIGDDCSGLYFGWYICVGIQAQTQVSLAWSTSATNATIPKETLYTPPIATAVPAYTASPQQAGIPSTCQNYYQAKADDNCNNVLATYNYITKDQFFAWNPALSGNCQGLWLGYFYCVANFNASSLPMPPTVTASASPTTSNTISTCTSWYKTVVNDDCDSIALWFGTISTADFISWNPSVGLTCSNIKQDIYYCVGIPGTRTTRTTALLTTTAALRPTQTGIASNCTQYWLVSSADTCTSIIANANVAATDFYAWNPALGSTCAGLKADFYVCVSTTVSSSITPTITTTIGVTVTISSSTTSKSSSSVSSTSKTTSTTSTSKTSSSTSKTSTTSGPTAVTTPTPNQGNMVSGCVRFYFRNDAAGLFCFDIAADAGIALADFYKWNPGVGSDCSGLWANTWYCIGISGPGTTITAGVPKPTK